VTFQRLLIRFFTTQCTVQSAVLRLHVVCPSVCDVDRSGPHRLEILETNCIDNYINTFALGSSKDILLIPGEHGENLGIEQLNWALAQKRCKLAPKLLLGTNRKSAQRFRLAPISLTLDALERRKRPPRQSEQKFRRPPEKFQRR